MWHFRKLAAANKVLSVKRYTYYRSSGTPPIYTHIRKSIYTALVGSGSPRTSYLSGSYSIVCMLMYVCVHVHMYTAIYCFSLWKWKASVGARSVGRRWPDRPTELLGADLTGSNCESTRSPGRGTDCVEG